MGRGRGGSGRSGRSRGGGSATTIAQNRNTANLSGFYMSLNWRDRQHVVLTRGADGRQTIDRLATTQNLGRQSRRDEVSFGRNSAEFRSREQSRRKTLDAIDRVLGIS